MQHLSYTELEQLEAQLNHIKRRCEEELRTEISEANGDRAARAGEGAGDAADHAQEDSLTLREEGMVVHYTAELADVAAALERIASGSFGVCVDCDAPVPVQRLMA